MRRALAVAVGLALAACSASGPVAPPAHPGPPPPDDGARAAELAAAEGRILEAIGASDPRFARRMGGVSEDRKRAASVKALAEGDGDVAIEEGAVDFFSFTARARALDEAARTFAGAPVVRDPAAAEEREVLGRLVEEERARLGEERSLPAGASALVRGLVDTWTAPASPRAVEGRDARVAERIDGVRRSLAPAAPGAAASREIASEALVELDDALDPLERQSAPDTYPRLAQAIARLRVALGEAAGRGQVDAQSWERLRAGLEVHLGVRPAGGEAAPLRAQLEAAEKGLRARAVADFAHHGFDERAVARTAQGLTLAEGGCEAAPSASRVRSLAPPPERAPICGAMRAVQAGVEPAARAAASVALHDDVVVALWALAIHGDRLEPARAAAVVRPFFGIDPVLETRWVRLATARPVAAIGAGLAAGALLRASAAEDAGGDGGAAGDAWSRLGSASSAWLRFGDAPLDIVEPRIAPGPAVGRQ